MSNRRGAWRWSLLILVVAVGGCAPAMVSIDYDRAANFGSYRTFDVEGGQVFRQGMPDPGDTLVRDRIDAALTAEMADKGLQPDPANPDLIVRYTNETYAQPEIRYDPAWGLNTYWGPYWGWGPFWGFHSYYPFGPDAVWVDTVEGNRITVELVDANTNKLVFRAEATAEDRNFRSPDYIRKTIEQALKRYPDRTPA